MKLTLEKTAQTIAGSIALMTGWDITLPAIKTIQENPDNLAYIGLAIGATAVAAGAITATRGVESIIEGSYKNQPNYREKQNENPKNL